MHQTLKITLGQHSDKGVKADNQDFLGSRLPKNSLLLIKGIAVAMADGISSSQVSQIASETAIRSFLEDYYCTSETWSVKTSVKRVLSATNSWLHSQSLEGPDRYDINKGYVCTVSALVIKNQTAHLFNLGDTRIYRLNHHGLEQLTHDHRLWGHSESGENKSYLSRALGMNTECNIDYKAVPVAVGDIFILATDGIYEFLTSQDISHSIIDNPSNDLNDTAKHLVAQAINNGSDDNLSIQLVRIDEIPSEDTYTIKQDVAQLPFTPTLSARMVFDGYKILRVIHSSSRSHVYLAEDIETGKQVVIKAPATDSSNDTDFLERFLMEEWIARRINNAHVLKADLQDRQRNYIYTVFEYIEGQTLAQWATDNPLPSIETVRGLVEQIAKGLQTFHRMEMLHQDLRPENIIIDKQGTVKIIDFGSVSVAGLQETMAERPATFLLGTALYSAPEYFLGDIGSTRSDLFSLGVITYFLLTGKYPYGTHVARTKTLSGQKKLHYQTVLNEDRAIPSWIDDAIRKAVCPLPERRYEELSEFMQDLRKPNKAFLNKTRPPLAESNPVALWQGISFILAVIIIYLLSR